MADKSTGQAVRTAELSRSGRAISELVMAEIFFVQASIESATALGDGLGALRRRFAADDEKTSRETIGEVLKRTRHEMAQPYSERLEMFRKLREEDKAA